jgi:hypothetical protein
MRLCEVCGRAGRAVPGVAPGFLRVNISIGAHSPRMSNEPAFVSRDDQLDAWALRLGPPDAW